MTSPTPHTPACPCAIWLPESTLTFLAIAAAHDRMTASEWITKAVCARIDEIGLGTALDMLKEGERL